METAARKSSPVIDYGKRLTQRYADWLDDVVNTVLNNRRSLILVMVIAVYLLVLIVFIMPAQLAIVTAGFLFLCVHAVVYNDLRQGETHPINRFFYYAMTGVIVMTAVAMVILQLVVWIALSA
jgi:hypothetical protein